MPRDEAESPSSRTLQEHREIIAELLENSRQLPTDTQVLKATLTIAANTSEAESTRVEALIFLQEFVEDYDKANGSQPPSACILSYLHPYRPRCYVLQIYRMLGD